MRNAPKPFFPVTVENTNALAGEKERQRGRGVVAAIRAERCLQAIKGVNS